MMRELLAVAQLINRTNTVLLGFEGLLFGVILFGGLFFYLQHRAHKPGGLL